MPIKVGDSLNYKGSPYICIAIEKRQAQQLAPENSTAMQASLREQVNTRHLDLKVAEYEADDVINIYAEWCILQRQSDTQFIYTKYHITKEIDNGSNGSEDADKAASG